MPASQPAALSDTSAELSAPRPRERDQADEIGQPTLAASTADEAAFRQLLLYHFEKARNNAIAAHAAARE